MSNPPWTKTTQKTSDYFDLDFVNMQKNII